MYLKKTTYNFVRSIYKFFCNVKLSSYKKNIYEIFNASQPISLLDIGAAGDIEPRWEVVSKYVNYIGIEPDSRSRASLQKKHKFNNYQILDSFAWNKEENIQFNLCRKEQVSSAYEPNKQFINRFSDPRRFDVLKKLNIEAEPLFKEEKLVALDFVKLDIQGAEKNALEGLGDFVDEALGFEIEVEFQDIYVDQPKFGEINNLLIKKNFEFIDLTSLFRWTRNEHKSFRTGGQLIFGDGLWLKSPELIINQDREKILKYISICALYGRFDIISFVLKNTNIKKNKDYSKAVKYLAKRYRNINIFNRIFNKLIPIFISLPLIKNHQIF